MKKEVEALTIACTSIIQRKTTPIMPHFDLEFSIETQSFRSQISNILQSVANCYVDKKVFPVVKVKTFNEENQDTTLQSLIQTIFKDITFLLKTSDLPLLPRFMETNQFLSSFQSNSSTLSLALQFILEFAKTFNVLVDPVIKKRLNAWILACLVAANSEDLWIQAQQILDVKGCSSLSSSCGGDSSSSSSSSSSDHRAMVVDVNLNENFTQTWKDLERKCGEIMSKNDVNLFQNCLKEIEKIGKENSHYLQLSDFMQSWKKWSVYIQKQEFSPFLTDSLLKSLLKTLSSFATGYSKGHQNINWTSSRGFLSSISDPAILTHLYVVLYTCVTVKFHEIFVLYHPSASKKQSSTSLSSSSTTTSTNVPGTIFSTFSSLSSCIPSDIDKYCQKLAETLGFKVPPALSESIKVLTDNDLIPDFIWQNLTLETLEQLSKIEAGRALWKYESGHVAFQEAVTLFTKENLKLSTISSQRFTFCVRYYLLGASLETNFFSFPLTLLRDSKNNPFPIMDEILRESNHSNNSSSLIIKRLIYSFVALKANIQASVLAQFLGDTLLAFKLLQDFPPFSLDPKYFVFFWELPILELLYSIASKSGLTLAANQLFALIGRPEYNQSNPLEWRASWIEQSKLNTFKKLLEDFLLV